MIVVGSLSDQFRSYTRVQVHDLLSGGYRELRKILTAQN